MAVRTQAFSNKNIATEQQLDAYTATGNEIVLCRVTVNNDTLLGNGEQYTFRWKVNGVQFFDAPITLIAANQNRLAASAPLLLLAGETMTVHLQNLSAGAETVQGQVDWLTEIATTGDAFARLGAPAEASIAADIATRATPAQILKTPAQLIVTDEDGYVTAATAEALGTQALEQIGDAPYEEDISGHNTKGTFGRLFRKMGAYRLIDHGVVASATETTLTVVNGLSGTDEYYRNCEVVIHEGVGEGQARRVESYDGDTKTFTLSRAWDIIPEENDEFQIHIKTLSKLAPDGTANDELVAAIVAALMAMQGTGFVKDTHSLVNLRGDTIKIGTSTYTVQQPVAASDEITLYLSDDYPAGHELAVTKTSYLGPDLTVEGTQVFLRIMRRDLYDAGTGETLFESEGTLEIVEDTVRAKFALTPAELAVLPPSWPPGDWTYKYQVLAVLPPGLDEGGVVRTLGLGDLRTMREIPPVEGAPE